jgi:hypothetical protein
MVEELDRDPRKELYSMIYYEDVNLLITHAGLHKYNYDILVREAQHNRTQWWQELVTHCILTEGKLASIPFAIGKSRGGRSKVGGIFWCDWTHEFDPIPVNQIFGHTRLINEPEDGPIRERSYTETENSTQKIWHSYCIDCLDVSPTVVEVYAEDGNLCVNPVSLSPYLSVM